MFLIALILGLDPFCGTGTTMVASLRYGRNSIGIDIDPEYCRMAARFLERESSNLFLKTVIHCDTKFFTEDGEKDK